MLSTYLSTAFVNYAENSNRTRQLAVKITIVLKILRRAPATESTSRSSPPEQHPFRRHRIHIEVVATRFETAVTIGIDQIIRHAFGRDHLDHVKLVSWPLWMIVTSGSLPAPGVTSDSACTQPVFSNPAAANHQ